MRRTTPLALAAAVLILTGCGSQSGGSAGSDGKASPSASIRSPHPSAGGCVSRAELTAADNGRQVCLRKGGELRLTLDGTKERPWKPVAVSGTALEAINAGFVIRPGDATAAYRAVSAGKAELTSSRPLCAEPTAPGAVSCLGIRGWKVTVTVR
ncbi:hypothetical protein [Streptomyces sp. NK08204]|uniref:hypothetical protein n=1 Tax=Streptomyces sp. NK08204 TaxID=2873260 RepID=UPI001CEC6864|nr:hypothetical protein [Streptomyces sp. NK08204]